MNLQKMNAIMFRIFYLTLVVMLLSCSNKPAGNQTAATTPEVKRTEEWDAMIGYWLYSSAS